MENQHQISPSVKGKRYQDYTRHPESNLLTNAPDFTMLLNGTGLPHQDANVNLGRSTSDEYSTSVSLWTPLSLNEASTE